MRQIVVLGCAASGLLVALGWLSLRTRSTHSRPGTRHQAQPVEPVRDSSGTIAPRLEHVGLDTGRSSHHAAETTVQDPVVKFQQALAAASQQGHLAPAAVRTLMQSALADTGGTSAHWTYTAESTFRAIGTEARDQLHLPNLQITSPQCYAAGCIASITFPQNTDFLSAEDSLATSKTLRGWPGAKMASPPELQPNGALATSWILFRPTQSGT